MDGFFPVVTQKWTPLLRTVGRDRKKPLGQHFLGNKNCPPKNGVLSRVLRVLCPEDTYDFVTVFCPDTLKYLVFRHYKTKNGTTGQGHPIGWHDMFVSIFSISVHRSFPTHRWNARSRSGLAHARPTAVSIGSRSAPAVGPAVSTRTAEKCHDSRENRTFSRRQPESRSTSGETAISAISGLVRGSERRFEGVFFLGGVLSRPDL